MRTLTQLATATALVAMGLPATAQDADKAASPVKVHGEIRAVGQPVVSPDGKWIAVREAADRLIVVDPTAPVSERQGFKCTPPASKRAWGWSDTPAPAAFAADSSAVVVTGPDGITLLTLRGETTITRHEAPDRVRPAAPGRAGVFPMLYPDGPPQARPAGPPGRARPSRWMLRLWTPTGWRGEPIAVTGSATIRWIDHPTALAATTASGDVIALDPATGKTTTLATKAEVQAAVGEAAQKPLRVVHLIARATDGALILEAIREYKRTGRVRGLGGGRRLADDERPKRGRNPGSAEPPPEMPRYRLLKRDGRVRRISTISKARWLDTWIEAPSADGRSFLRLQVANAGGAWSGIPEIWTHLRMWPGEYEEHPLGRAGLAADLEAPKFEWLQTAPDASQGLVLMRANRVKKFDVADIGVLMQRYERGSARGKTLRFEHYGIYRVEAKGKLTPLVRGVGEGIAPFDDDTDLPGKLGRPAWCAATRTLVASLQAPMDPGKSRGLVLIRVPK